MKLGSSEKSIYASSITTKPVLNESRILYISSLFIKLPVGLLGEQINSNRVVESIAFKIESVFN